MDILRRETEVKQTDNTEADLVRRCRSGDSQAFRTIVEIYGRTLFGIAYLMTHDRTLAEDAVQAALVRAWQCLPSLRVESNLKVWLIRIVINEVKQQYRKKKLPEVPLDQVPEPVAGDPPEIETRILREEEHRQLRQAIEMLPAEQKEAVMLRYFGELTVPEVASVMKCREGTIKSRLNRALGRIKEILDTDKDSDSRGKDNG